MISLFPSRAVALELFGFSIHWYGIMYLLAFLGAAVLLPRIQRTRGLTLSRDQWLDLLSWGILGVLLGGRLGFVFFYEPSFFLQHPLSILAVWEGGMSSHGGFIGLASALYVSCRRMKIDPWVLGDLVTVPGGIGLALGRLGNFINQELYGSLTSLPWGIRIPDVDGLRHPVAIYEGCADLMIAGICFLLLRKAGVKRGKVMAVFLILYGCARFLLEYVRAQQYAPFQWGAIWLTRGQLLTAPIIAISVILLLIVHRKAAVVLRDV